MSEHRGFKTLDKALHREYASMGGKAAHRNGTAHEWDAEAARAAGRKGGAISAARRAAKRAGAACATTPSGY